MLVLKTTSPKVSPSAPKPQPVKTVPSSRASFATRSVMRLPLLSGCRRPYCRDVLSRRPLQMFEGSGGRTGTTENLHNNAVKWPDETIELVFNVIIRPELAGPLAVRKLPCHVLWDAVDSVDRYLLPSHFQSRVTASDVAERRKCLDEGVERFLAGNRARPVVMGAGIGPPPGIGDACRPGDAVVNRVGRTGDAEADPGEVRELTHVD